MSEARKNTGQLPAEPFDPRQNLRKGGGRPKGVPNKTTTAIKDMITQALDKAGGVDYLVKQAEENPGPFLALVGKVLPLQVTGDKDNPVALVTMLPSDKAL